MKLTFYNFCFSVLLLFFSKSVCGQNFSIGVSAGTPISTIDVEEEDKYYGDLKYILRFTARGDIMLHLSEKVGIKFEVAYQQIGMRRKEPGGLLDKYKFDYLCFPLITQASFGKKNRVTAHLGASINFLLKQRWLNDGFKSDRVVNDTNEYPSTDYSVLSGIGSEFFLSKNISMQLDGRFMLGIKTLQKENSWVKFNHISFIPTIGLRHYINK